jgi:phytoene dehydrogenase-like protein
LPSPRRRSCRRCRRTRRPPERSDFTLCAGTDAHERAWDEAKHGRASTHPYVDCVVPTWLDPGLAPPDRHVLTAFVITRRTGWPRATGR